jgi:hypothetical protein
MSENGLKPGLLMDRRQLAWYAAVQKSAGQNSALGEMEHADD